VLHSALLSASRSPRVERLVTRAPLSRAVVRRFVGGPDAATAVTSVATLVGYGLDVSLDYLGEDTTDAEQAGAVVAAYAELTKALSIAGLVARTGPRRPGPGDSRIDLSVKLTAIGLALPHDGPQIALENARQISKNAGRIGATVTLDMEDHTRTDATLEILRELRAEFPETGAVLQAYLRRTEGDCRELTGPRSRVRLCKGAYREPASVAYATPAEIDRSYVRCLKILMAGEGYPMLATHDPRLIAITHDQAKRCGRDRTGYEFQMLYGVRPRAQRKMVQELQRVRVYVPYGAQWYGYLMRRLAERPANLAFFARSLATRG
jgi:proline dehydrogenase